MTEPILPATPDKKSPLTMETLVAFCKRKGFIFQASEIYGGLNGFFDYGPLGVELKNNIKQAWWHDFVHMRDDMVGLDSAIIQHPRVWEASGHVATFNDPMVDDKESKMRFRADHLMWAKVVVAGEVIGCVSILKGEGYIEELEKMADKLKRKLQKQGVMEPLAIKPFTEATEPEIPLIPSPATGKPGNLTAARQFNLMFKTQVGALEDSSSMAYLRPETAQGIFTNFKNVLDTGRVKIPFGVAQIGKSFRNEITPRNFIFRVREFEHMEFEYFIQPDDDVWPKVHAMWIAECRKWFASVGVSPEKMSECVYEKKDLAHYARACTDIFFEFPFGKEELMGIAARGDFDLRQHQQFSGKSMEYFDETTKRKYIPHVIEPSWGLDRTLVAILLSAYDEDVVEGEKRVVLRLKPRVAPYKAAVFPLLKNKPELTVRAEKLYDSLRKKFRIDYDESGAIGRRYRRQDETGTPFCITVDFQTLEDGTVTVRDRDTTQQVRVKEEELANWLGEKME
jgi:glycyl-tRNA synthetase